MTFVESPSTSSCNVTTGLEVEEQCFTWTIENFHVIRNHTCLIDSQKIYFAAGSSVGRPSKWRVFLQENVINKKNWFGIYCIIEKPSASDSKWSDVSAQLAFAMEGAVSWKGETRPIGVSTFTEGWGRGHFIDHPQAGAKTKEKLVINITFKLYFPSKQTQPCRSIVQEFQAWKDVALKDPTSSQEIKIISKDKKVFTVQMGILTVRGPKFKAMLESHRRETKAGVIYFPDISSKVLQNLLAFLNTGELHPNWSETAVVLELMNAAGKYQIPDLLRFLDETLGKVCKTENVLALYTLAHQLSLKTAEEELSKIIHAHSISPETCCKMMKGIPFLGQTESVPSASKRKSRFWTFLSSPFKALFAKN